MTRTFQLWVKFITTAALFTLFMTGIWALVVVLSAVV